MTAYHCAYVFERFPTFTQTFCAREVRALQERGLRPLIFSIRDTRDEPSQDFAGAFDVHYLPSEKELVEIVKGLKKEQKLPQEVVLTLRHWGERPDKMRVYEAAYIGLQMRAHKVRHAHTHFAGIGARTCFWMKKFYGHYYSFTGHANDIFSPRDFEVGLSDLLEEASLVIAVSDFAVRYLRENYPQAAGKIRRVYNGIAVRSFEEASKLPERFAMLSVGRCIEKKGFADFIEAAAILKGRGVDFEATIIGEGPLFDSLQKSVSERGLEGCFHLVGALPQEQVRTQLQRTSLFVLPCVEESDGGMDNLPTVIMEAMAASLPTLTTPVAGVPEMVVEGETGVLVGEHQPAVLAEAMEMFAREEPLRQRYGAAARERAMALFDLSVTSRALLGLMVARGRVRFSLNLLAKNLFLLGGYGQQGVSRLTEAIKNAGDRLAAFFGKRRRR